MEQNKDELLKINARKMKEIGIDLGNPRGEKNAKYKIDTETLEIQEVEVDEYI